MDCPRPRSTHPLVGNPFRCWWGHIHATHLNWIAITDLIMLSVINAQNSR